MAHRCPLSGMFERFRRNGFSLGIQRMRDYINSVILAIESSGLLFGHISWNTHPCTVLVVRQRKPHTRESGEARADVARALPRTEVTSTDEER